MATHKRILIFYITERSGHHSAALALKKALQLVDAQSTVACVNAFKYAFPFADRLINRIYLTVIKRVPKIWETIYDNPKLVGRSQGIKNWIHRIGIGKLKSLMEQFKPDAIVCTQAFPCGIVSDYKKAYSSGIPLIAVLTDLAPHSFWVYDSVDHYIAHCEETRQMLVQKGVPEHKIKLLGIPIDPKFSVVLDRAELFANYGLKNDVPVVLLMGGGRGLGPIKDALYELDVADIELQIIVVCGLNRRLYDWVRKTKFKNRILAYRFTDQIDRLMSLASCIITKPGGITTAEALAKRLPMIILNPIPGQEARNTELLIRNKAAFKADTAQELLASVKKALKAAQERKGFPGKPDSSLQIARFVLSL